LNFQFLLKNEALYVIECNLRASRTFPFISKMSGYHLIEWAAKVFLNEQLPKKMILKKSESSGEKSRFFLSSISKTRFTITCRDDFNR
jgi:carbamoylphosphate synthase large subunit